MKIIENTDKNFFEKIEIETLDVVKKIVEDVKKNGDDAVLKYSEKFGDGFEGKTLKAENIEVSKEEIQKAFKNIEKNNPEIIEAINFSIKNVKEFAKKQFNCLKKLDTKVFGNLLGHRIIPLETVGCYIPGGNYPLISSAVMTIVPAKVAGVKKIIATSSKIQDAVIVACSLSGADKIYRVGGAQAVSALAFGTKSIDKVDKIVGPGNKYVTAAKKYVFGECGIDFLAGPSEILIIADDNANVDFVAADMLAQCEHDEDARAYLICFSHSFAQKVEKKAREFLKDLPTKNIAEKSFEKSFAIVTNNFEEAIDISNKKAPEHLELCFKNAQNYVDKFKNYGSIFIGDYSAEVFGDYCSGTNHTLPTNQVARYCGGLSVFDFVKIQTYQKIEKKNIKQISKYSSILAQNEGLFAHKLASDLRRAKLQD